MFESLNKLAYTQVLGGSVLFYTAIILLILIIITGLSAYLYYKRIAAAKNYKIHYWVGILTIIVGLFHGLLGFAKYLL